MRFFVGTLHTIENEFDECVQSIGLQTYKNFNHFVFRNLPNKEAHIALFKSFLEGKNEYDVLIKVDADMVLASPSLFENILRKLEANNQVDVLSIAVHDFFSDQLIWGLNAYRNTVRWELENENLFVDRPKVSSEQYLMDDKELAPAAYHCKNPSSYQAFHYGVHRGLKVIQPDRSNKIEQSSRTHWNSLERTWINFQRSRDIRLGLACLGAELAFKGRFQIGHVDYANPHLKQVLDRYLSFNEKRLRFEIWKMRFLNGGFLPNRKRRTFICRFAALRSSRLSIDSRS